MSADRDLAEWALEAWERSATGALRFAPGPESSILKLKGTEIQQRIQKLGMEAGGQFSAAAAHVDNVRYALYVSDSSETVFRHPHGYHI